MGKFGPAFCAFFLNSVGIYIFRKPPQDSDRDCFPYLSYVVFLYAMFCLLWDSCIYPSSFRKLYWWCEIYIEFLLDMFIMECITQDFWLPVENFFVGLLVELAEQLPKQMEMFDLRSEIVESFCEALKSTTTLYVANYALTMFFLLCILHATRIVDFRILRCDGPRVFFCDNQRRTKRFVRRMIKSCKPKTTRHICFAPETNGRGNEAERDCGYDSEEYCNCDCTNTKFHSF